MRRYRVTHRTTYGYDLPMADGYTIAHLLLRDTPFQRVESSTVNVEPEPAELDEYPDAFGNRVTQFGVHRPHDGLVVEAVSTVVVSGRPPIDDGPTWSDVAERVAGARGADALSVAPFRASSQFVDLRRFGSTLQEIAAPSFAPGRGVVAVRVEHVPVKRHLWMVYETGRLRPAHHAAFISFVTGLAAGGGPLSAV